MRNYDVTNFDQLMKVWNVRNVSENSVQRGS